LTTVTTTIGLGSDLGFRGDRSMRLPGSETPHKPGFLLARSRVSGSLAVQKGVTSWPCVQRYGPLPAPTKVLFTKPISSRRCPFELGTLNQRLFSARSSPPIMSLFYDLPPSLTAASTLRGRLMLAVAKLMQNVFCFLIHTSVELGRVDGASEAYALPCPQRHKL